MILVCPSCDAKFKIPDGAIPAEGRTVRCAKCKNSWHATPTDIMRKPAAPAKPSAAAPARPAGKPAPAPVSFDGELDEKAARDAAELRRSVRGTMGAEEAIAKPRTGNPFDEDDGNEDATGTDDGTEDVGPDDDSDDFGVSAALKESMGDDFDKEFGDDEDPEEYDEDDYDEDDFLARRRADQRRQHERLSSSRKRLLMTIGLGGLIVFWLGVFYVFMFQKENMRHYFPGTSELVYSIFGTEDGPELYNPGDDVPLTRSPAEEEVYVRAYLVSTGVETRGGKQGLVLRGYVENAGITGAYVPQIRASILDASGNELDSWIINPEGLLLRKGRIDEKTGTTKMGGRKNFEDFRTPIPAGAKKTEVKVLEGTKSEPKPDVG